MLKFNICYNPVILLMMFAFLFLTELGVYQISAMLQHFRNLTPTKWNRWVAVLVSENNDYIYFEVCDTGY